MLANDLTAAVSAVCPIIGITIGNPADRSTWSINFDPSATEDQRIAGQAVLDAFVSTDASEETAEAMIASGLSITSTSVPSLNGIYSVSLETQVAIQAVMIYILANDRFPAGQASWPWRDQGGGLHFFPSTDSFKAFATAVADFVAAVDLSAKQPTPTWPSNTVTMP